MRDLIGKLLTTDPKLRYQVPDVRAHPWCGAPKAEGFDEAKGLKWVEVGDSETDELMRYRQIPEASTPILEEKLEQGQPSLSVTEQTFIIVEASHFFGFQVRSTIAFTFVLSCLVYQVGLVEHSMEPHVHWHRLCIPS